MSEPNQKESSSRSKIKLLIADDHMMVRQGMVMLLGVEQDMRVIGEAADGQQMVDMAGSLRPDVILADISMPIMNGIEAARVVHQQFPSIRLIMVSIHTSSSYVIRSLRSGALGYVVKTDDFQHVIKAIRAVTEGRRYLSERVSEQIIDAFVAGSTIDDNLDARISSREKEILQLIAEGNSNSQIANKLVLSTRTVETHRTNLMRKLGLNSQIDILRFAIR